MERKTEKKVKKRVNPRRTGKPEPRKKPLDLLTMTASRLRENIYNALDEVLRTGVPLELERAGRRLRIVPVDEPRSARLELLRPHPDYLLCDPEEVVHLDWAGEGRP